MDNRDVVLGKSLGAGMGRERFSFKCISFPVFVLFMLCGDGWDEGVGSDSVDFQVKKAYVMGK